MIEFFIIFTIVTIAVLYITKTYHNIFSKKEKPCESCACQKCPYTNTSECPIKTLDKSNKNIPSLPKKLDKDKNMEVVVGYEKSM